MKINSLQYKNRYVISDIHGCKKTLKALIKNISPQPEDAVFFLGDYIDRGPDSSGVIDYILKLREKELNIFLLRGNHEQDFLDSENEYDPDFFYRFSKMRLKSADLLNKKKAIKKRYRKFMQNTALYFELEDFLLVHAGFNFKKKDIFKDQSAMLQVRNYRVDLEKTAGRQVVHGHQPTYYSKIEKAVKKRKARIPLDNGCVYRKPHKIYDYTRLGALCCLNLNTMELTRQKNIE